MLGSPNCRTDHESDNHVYPGKMTQAQTVVADTPPLMLPDTLSRTFRKEVRNSALWAEKVDDSGVEEAEELPKQCRAELE